MPKIKSITKDNAVLVDVNPGGLLPDNKTALCKVSDVRFELTFLLEGQSTPVKLKATVSHKKHLASSYKDIGDYSPTSAKESNDNTLCNLSLSEFKAAFDEFGNKLIEKFTGLDTDSLNPEIVLGKVETSYKLAFMTNNDQFGKHFHCFPTINIPSPRAFNLTGRQLMDFVEIMRFLFNKGIDKKERPQTLINIHNNMKIKYSLYRLQPWFLELVEFDDRNALDEYLGGDEKKLGPKGKDLEEQLNKMLKEEREMKRLAAIAKKV
ncbi:hypothetical protein [Methylomonas rosea]|uniref:Uncharacterized protein n=1 Tax=Methylomonas rosea TaxID=2952227 RepID=A0ABT1TSY8_9GAMM|nr:hypothetical protein [Methylomonas sp. WSC-7]MCQ8117897.1 hypothetical protein [Methylomonas sp. WSC-7]